METLVNRLADQDFIYISKLGKGGFGEVSLVKHKISEQLYAVKTLRGDRKENPEDILREIKAIASFNHPNIINYQHSFLVEDELFLVMEYCKNGSLYDLIKAKKKLNIEEAVDIFRKLSQALYFVHKNGYVHHDIKPSNILFDASNQVKLSDFGTVNTSIGTIAYSAPEMLSPNSPTHDARTDVYSLGLTMMESLIGRLPIKQFNRVAIKNQIRKADFPLDSIPYWLKQLFLKACHYNPEMRFQDMLEFDEAMEKRFIPQIINNHRIIEENEVKVLDTYIKFRKWENARRIVENRSNSHIKFLISKAKYYLNTHKIDLAKLTYEKVLLKDPKAPIEKELAEIYLQTNQPAKAVSLLQSYLHYNFKDKEAHNQLLHSYFLSDQWELGLEQSGFLKSIFKDELIFRNNALLFELLLNITPTDKDIVKTGNFFATYNSIILSNVYKNKLGIINEKVAKKKVLFQEYKFLNIHKNKNLIKIGFPGDKEPVLCDDSIISFGRKGDYGNTFSPSPSTLISRRHFVLVNQKNNVWLYDLSLYGTYVDGKKVIGKEFIIGRCEIEFGNLKIVVNSEANSMF